MPLTEWLERCLRSITSLAVLMAVTVTVLVLPARPVSAAVGNHHALTWNSNGANWDTVRRMSRSFDVIAVQESGARPPTARRTVRLPFEFGSWQVLEYTWPRASWDPNPLYVYHLRMRAVRNSLAIVTTRPATAIYGVPPQTWYNRRAANRSARPAFGIQLRDGSAWWTWHAGSGASWSQRNDARNMILAISLRMRRIASWALLADFNRDMLNPRSGFTDSLGHWTLPDDVELVLPEDARGNLQITRPASGTLLDYMATNNGDGLQARTVGHFSDHLAVQFGSTLVGEDRGLVGQELDLIGQERGPAGEGLGPAGEGLGPAGRDLGPAPGAADSAVGQISRRDAPGTCLQAAVKEGGDIVPGTQVGPAKCDPLADTQYWSTGADGSVSLGDMCLTNLKGGTDDGNPVVLDTCVGGDEQVWVDRANGEMYNPATGKCLDGRPSDGELTLRTCARADTQLFTVAGVHGPSPAPPVTGALELPDDGAACLDHGLPGEGADVRAWACAPGSADQRWTVKGDTIREGSADKADRCLTNLKDGTDDGNPVVLAACDGGDSQRWQVRDDGSVHNPASGKCLADAAEPVIRTCDGGVLQSWDYDADAGVIEQTEIPTCADHRRTKDGAPVRRALCLPGDAGQQWTRVGDGTLREGTAEKTGRCLDNLKGGSDDGNPVVLNACDGGKSQQWWLRADGSLHNPATDKCAGTDGGPSLGAPFVLLPCTPDTGSWFSLKGTLDLPTDNPGCLDHGLAGAGASPATEECRPGSARQQWTPMKDGTLREGTADHDDNRCLDTEKGAPEPGTPVVLNPCDGGDSQQWLFEKDGTVLNPVSKACLTTGAQPTIEVCGEDPKLKPLQRWSYLVNEAVLQQTAAPTCVDHGQSGEGAPVRRRLCASDGADAADQQWTAVEKDGTLREGTAEKTGRCLDTGKAAPGDGVPVVLRTCDGGASQRWEPHDDGTLFNPASGRCAGTDGALAPGTPFVLLPCEPDLQWLLTGPEPAEKPTEKPATRPADRSHQEVQR
ncbi:ricin-type beta-trefoil lectin domain protein [Streptomyces sp. NPDC008159]|uniref:ricin-type beta-trefoil lectin domain protein n=1 Tax=Streptomyces sp. NPDC008159 TaxID=3364817 RepID=UPI0036EE305B